MSGHVHDSVLDRIAPTGADPAPVPWPTAAKATWHCLTGCAIGEVLGMVIGTAAGLHDATTVILSITLAFVFGYGLTVRGVLRAGLGLRTALGVALAADTVSVNRAMIRRGRGHAILHSYHHAAP
jgi:Domain of unknown function (DUF4396)